MRLYQRLPILVTMLLVFVASGYAAITGVISGTVTDPTGAVMPGVTVAAVDEATGLRHTALSDNKGFYSFPALDVGIYTVSVSQTGFQTFARKGIKVDINSSIRSDIALQLGSVSQTETVTSNAVQVETQSTQLGEVIESERITAVPLNGRAFTDLLALQPGVSPYSDTSEGAKGGVSGSLNPGNMSINGGREASNGFMVNGGDVNDGVQNGAAIIPNLDSISEFRIITSNFDAEYGNFSGGQVNVATKNGTNQFHGSGFEFLRNTAFNAANYFSNHVRSAFNQNIYGGTLGGPIKRDKVFFFADFQGTNNTQGTNDLAQVPSAADKTGNVSDLSSFMTGYTVVGSGWAGVLSKRLGYTVTPGENYYTGACASTAQCVFPGAIIPTKAWSPVASQLFKYMPEANTTQSGLPYYATTSNPQTLKDYKEAGRVDYNTRFGTFFAYYFMDNDSFTNPYAGGTAGGFAASTTGRAQMSNIGLTTTFKNNSVNNFRFTYMRSATHTNNPTYGTGPSLASLGFTTPWGPAGGIANINPSLVGVPQISINSLSFGTPTQSQAHFDNTFQWLDNYMKVVGTHTLQFGLNYHYDQVNERNFYLVNGGFNFSDGNETGSAFADFLLGADAGSFTQATPQLLDSRSHYAAGYVEDSWRARSNLTLNYGIRYEVSTPWYDTTNKLETIIPGEQSQVFPGAPLGWVFPGDKGVARTLAPVKWNKFAPRFGFAYAPSSGNGIFNRFLGGPDAFSIRGGFGLFYTNFQDQSGFVEVGDAPYGLYYSAPVPTMLETPYVDRATQTIEAQKFPFAWPPTNVSVTNPDSNIPWASLEPLSSSDAVDVHNTLPYLESYFLSMQRGIGRDTVFTATYSGSQGRHLANSMEANPGNVALCLSLTKSALAPGQTACGPKLESQSYTLANGTVVPGTRPLDGLAFGSNPYLQTHATSNFNSLQTNLKHTSRYWDVLLGYTFGRSFDNASAMTDPIYVYDHHASYGLSKFNVTHYFVGSYNVHLPFDLLVGNTWAKRIVGGWSVTGITKLASGTPITLTESDDRSLTGTNADLPNYTPGDLHAGAVHGDRNPRDVDPVTGKRYPYFNTSLFTREAVGQYGNSHRRFFSGPGLDHTDLAILRSFHIRESHTVQFRAEAFNVLNHAEFANPSGSVTSSIFGVVTATQPNQQRVLQLAVRYQF